MNLREKVSVQEFSIDTTLGPEAIREAGKHAAEAGTRFLDNKVVENGVADSAIRYAVMGPAGFVQAMEIFVRWEELEDDKRRVSLEVGGYMADRMTLWRFIPIGPKTVSAMGPLKRFSARLRKELDPGVYYDMGTGMVDRDNTGTGMVDRILSPQRVALANGLNGYKIAQICGAVLVAIMVFMFTVVGFYRISTAITWLFLMLVGVGIYWGAARLNEMSRERERDEELARNRKLNATPGDERPPAAREYISADDSHHVPTEDRIQPTEESNDAPPSEPPSPPEPARGEASTNDLHPTITEALDRMDVSYHRSEEGAYAFAREDVVLMIAARDADENVPVAVSIQATVLEKVERTKDLAIDLLERNSHTMFAAWLIDNDSSIADKRQPEGMVRVILGYDLNAEQPDVELVRSMVGRVLNTALSYVGELQSAHGGERPLAVVEEPITEEPASMPQGPITYTGRYPGYEPNQAMETFFSASAEHDRPSYEEGRDGWVFDDGRNLIAVGCFVEPDGTPTIALTCVSKSGGSTPPMEPFMNAFFYVVQRSADSTHVVLPDEEIAESGEHGTLRQLRPSEVGPIPHFASEKPAEENGASLRFDGLYHARGPSYQSYLRFYADGTVLQVSTNGKPEQLARWFGKTHTEVPRGTYAIEGQSIEFSTVSSEGTVAYKGQILDDTVELSSRSDVDGHEDRATYSFVRVALP